jgi:hypothetical protein
LRGGQICLPARLVHVAGPVEVFSRRHGLDGARAMARRNRGTQFDGDLADLFLAHAPATLDGLNDASDWSAVLDAEPQLSRRVDGAELDGVLEAMADLVDLKSPYSPATHAAWPTSPVPRLARPGCRSTTSRRSGAPH